MRMAVIKEKVFIILTQQAPQGSAGKYVSIMSGQRETERERELPLRELIVVSLGWNGRGKVNRLSKFSVGQFE